MSNNSTAPVHEEDHTGPIKNPKQLLLFASFAFVVPIFVIIGLVYSVTTQNKPAAGAVDLEMAVMQRIQKVGMVEIRNANREARSGEQVYKAQCTNCHAAGLVGAPKLGDTAAWARRLKTGFETLVTSALKGKNAMGAQGGGEFDDFEIARAVAYMGNAAGAKFTEPPKPAAAQPAK
ncbi:MAG: c-type cytochrome [Rhodoferax sp.]|nr:c-type cytochrome [Rhodoferax sp.]MCF8211473.1 c-type cytochrome [Rhodoferax sp.]